MLLKMVRRFNLMIPGLITDEQCGALNQKSFDITVVAEATRLDEHGFIIDNPQIVEVSRDYFAAGMWKASCEEIAGTICRLVAGLLGDRFQYVETTVSPWNQSEITVGVHECEILSSLPSATAIEQDSIRRGAPATMYA